MATHIYRPGEAEAIETHEVSSIKNPDLGIIICSDDPHWATVKNGCIRPPNW